MIQPAPDLFPLHTEVASALLSESGILKAPARGGEWSCSRWPTRRDFGIIYAGFTCVRDGAQVAGRRQGSGSHGGYDGRCRIAREDVRIAVVGSSNMDLVVRSSRIPVVGETVLGGDFIMVPGGKGANQAVAAAKLGAHVHFIARLGNDMFGRKSLENLTSEGLDTTYVTLTSDAFSGVALITVDETGNNAIVVAPGANALLSIEDVRRAEADIRSAGALAAQLEVPLKTVQYAAQIACDAGVPFILDPAPAQKLGPELLQMVDGTYPPKLVPLTMLGFPCRRP